MVEDKQRSIFQKESDKFSTCKIYNLTDKQKTCSLLCGSIKIQLISNNEIVVKKYNNILSIKRNDWDFIIMPVCGEIVEIDEECKNRIFLDNIYHTHEFIETMYQMGVFGNKGCLSIYTAKSGRISYLQHTWVFLKSRMVDDFSSELSKLAQLIWDLNYTPTTCSRIISIALDNGVKKKQEFYKRGLTIFSQAAVTVGAAVVTGGSSLIVDGTKDLVVDSLIVTAVGYAVSYEYNKNDVATGFSSELFDVELVKGELITNKKLLRKLSCVDD